MGKHLSKRHNHPKVVGIVKDSVHSTGMKNKQTAILAAPFEGMVSEDSSGFKCTNYDSSKRKGYQLPGFCWDSILPHIV